MPRDIATDTRDPTRNDGKIKSAREAIRLIQSGDTVATGGFVGIGDDVARALVANGPRLPEFPAQQAAGEMCGLKRGI